jgi:hypothetical protein
MLEREPLLTRLDILIPPPFIAFLDLLLRQLAHSKSGKRCSGWISGFRLGDGIA